MTSPHQRSLAAATCRKRTYTCAPCALHTLQHVHRDSNERARSFGIGGRGMRDERYIRSKGSIPSMVSPAASTRFVAEQSASRESRTAPEDCNTGHCS